MFTNNLIAGAAGQSTGFYPVSIDQSLRFNDDDSAYLTFDPAADGDRDNWSLSFWFKRANLGLTQLLFGQGTSGSNNRDIVYIAADDTLEVASYGGSYVFRYITTQKFRDPSAWYHLVISYQSGDATASDRLRIYLNGERVTAFSTSTDPSQNTDSAHFNSGSPQYIGRYIDQSGSYLDGYMAEVNFIDGTALDASSFGELKNGVWIPKDPSGLTYGTNGFYLDFANSADIGNDVSGEGNDWTPNNFTASDVVLDSPTDSFATWNSVFTHGSTYAATLSDGNLTMNKSGGGQGGFISTIGAETGKYYAEITVDALGFTRIGVVADANLNAVGTSEYPIGNSANSVSYTSDTGNVITNSSGSAYGDSYSAGNVIGIAFDADTGKVWFAKNNTWQNSGDPVAGTNPATTLSTGNPFFFGVAGENAFTIDANFGQQDFTYTPPTDYLALSTANLPEPTISPADDASPVDYFGTLLWSGDDNATRTVAVGQSGITGDVNFTPDFTWVKRRNGATNGSDHMLLDAVRGVGTFNALVSNGPSPDGTRQEGRTQAGSLWTNFGDIDSFTTDGFVVQKGSDPSHTLEGINQTGGTYVGWNWRLGGAPTVDNSAGVGAVPTAGSVKVDGSNYGSALAGSIAATRLSANTTSGCSIVTYTGTGSDGTIAHGLSEAPEMLVFRRRDADGTDHLVYHSALGAGKNLRHNNTDAENTNTDFFQNTEPTSSVFSIGGSALNTSGRTFVVYCFHSVDGFSKVGSYTGNGSTDGTFVYTGFRPSWIMVKQSSASGEHWEMWDDKRSTYNINTPLIYANLINAEGGNSSRYDVLSNGFKLRTTNAGANASATYIYMAFAENPFKYSNAR